MIKTFFYLALFITSNIQAFHQRNISRNNLFQEPLPQNPIQVTNLDILVGNAIDEEINKNYLFPRARLAKEFFQLRHEKETEVFIDTLIKETIRHRNFEVAYKIAQENASQAFHNFNNYQRVSINIKSKNNIARLKKIDSVGFYIENIIKTKQKIHDIKESNEYCIQENQSLINEMQSKIDAIFNKKRSL